MSASFFRALSAVLALASLAAMLNCAGTRASGPAIEDALMGRSEALIELRSDGCESGQCPVYGVAIYADGSVVYRGGAHAAIVGQRRSKIPETNVATLVDALENMDFIDTPEHCCDCHDAPDNPPAAKLVIDYRPGGVEKEIVVDARCSAVPDVVRSLAEQIQVTTVATLALPTISTTRLAGESATPPVR